jgi:hypothetical protein
MIENNDLKDFILKAIVKNKSEEPKKRQTFMEYIKSDDGIKKLLNLGSLAVASNQSPYVASSIASGIKERRLAREKAKKEQTNNFGLDEIGKILDLAEKVNKPQAEFTKFTNDLKKEGISPINENEDIVDIPKQFIQNIQTPDGQEKIFIDRKNLNKATNEANLQAKYNQTIIDKNNDLLKNSIDKLLTKDNVLTARGSELTTNPRFAFIDRFGNEKFRDMEAIVKTLKSNLGFQELQKMRDNSPTGGSLGSITEKELDFLQSAVAALDVGMSEEQIIDSLSNIRNSLLRINESLEINPNKILMGNVKKPRKSMSYNIRGRK